MTSSRVSAGGRKRGFGRFTINLLDDLEFDRDTHEYRINGGDWITGPSSDLTGVEIAYPDLVALSEKELGSLAPIIKDITRQTGIAVHAARVVGARCAGSRHTVLADLIVDWDDRDLLHVSFRHCRHLSSGMLQPVRRDATCRRQNFPRRVAAPRAPKLRRQQVLRSAAALQVHPSFPVCRLSPRLTAFRQGDPSCNSSLNSSPPPAAGSARSARYQPLLPEGKARPEARYQDPVFRRDRGVLRVRLEPAQMTRFPGLLGGPFHIDTEGRGR